MKRVSLILYIPVLAGFGAWLGMSHVWAAMARAACKRHAADLMSIAEVVKDYRVDHGGYPPAMSVEELRAAVEPKYIRLLPSWHVLYYSDGAHYDLSFLDQTEGELQSSCSCQLRIRDGLWVSWPRRVLPPEWLNIRAT